MITSVRRVFSAHAIFLGFVAVYMIGAITSIAIGLVVMQHGESRLRAQIISRIQFGVPQQTPAPRSPPIVRQWSI